VAGPCGSSPGGRFDPVDGVRVQSRQADPARRRPHRGRPGIYVDFASCPSDAIAWKLLSGIGATVTTGSCQDNEVRNLTEGTYQLDVTPYLKKSGTYSMAVYVVPADASVGVTVGGSAQTVSTTVPGQNAAFTFAGTAGQRVAFNFTGGCGSPIPTAGCSCRRTASSPV